GHHTLRGSTHHGEVHGDILATTRNTEVSNRLLNPFRGPRDWSFGITPASWRSGPEHPSAHGLRPVDRLPQDVGVAGVLRGLGEQVQQHPADRPARTRLEPR